VLLALVAGMLCLAIAVLAVVFQSRSRNAPPVARPRATPTNASVSTSALDAVRNADAHLVDVARVSGSAEIKLLAPMVVVGRVATNTQADDVQSLVIEQSTIGRRHATIEFRHGGFWLRDAQSLNGTFLNDERLAADASSLLKVHDRVRFHDVEFHFASAQQAADQTVFAEVNRAANEKTVYAQDANEPSKQRSSPAASAAVAAPVAAAGQQKTASKAAPANAQHLTGHAARAEKPVPTYDLHAQPAAAEKHEKPTKTIDKPQGADTLDADDLEAETLLSVSLTDKVALAKNRDVKPTGPNLQLLDISEVSGATLFELTGQNVSVGKAAIPERGTAENYLSIPRNTVSKVHAKLHFADSTYWISDNHSANGTFVNDLRVIDRIALRIGDTLRFATFEFTVTAVAADTATVDGILRTGELDFATDSTSIIEKIDDEDSDKTMMMNE
jgi:pSer/pThr/pTyr-binding forkhead associated (FHA) protein